MYLKKLLSFFGLIIFCLFISFQINAQSDTIKTYNLNSVEIKAPLHTSSNLNSSPEQVLSKNKFEKLNAFQVADALKFFTGVQIKDYGGIGGLKTVSIRNMGAHYTTVSYDGIPITNYLTGQIDLSRFSLDNVEMLQLNIGESDDIFQPAKNLALAGSLNINTHSFYSVSEKRNEITASMKAGSFGLLNPSLTFKSALNEVFTLYGSAEYLKSKGNYKYTQTYGYVNDSTAKIRRKNSEVENWKLEANLAGKFNNGGKLLIKTYYFDSDRGVPGTSNYYNEENRPQSIKEDNAFSQISYIQPLNSQWDIQGNAKIDIAHTEYIDHHPVFENGEKKDKYKQEEYYINATVLFKLNDQVSFSWANDGIHGKFKNDRISPHRNTWLSAISGKYQTNRLTINGSLLNNFTEDPQRAGKSNSDHLSPYLGISFRPMEGRSLRLRAFYKNSYRLPTFGDMYFPEVPNPNLKAENTHQYNLGVTVKRSSGILFPYLAFSLDTYINKVENKIVWSPGQSLLKPSVRNFGKVNTRGLDLNLEFHLNVTSDITAEVSWSYTYQHVREKKDGKSFIMPYTPKHSGSGYISLRSSWIDLNYNWIRCGKRYFNQTEDIASELKPYSEYGISLVKRLKINSFKVHLSAECNNILNKQYEVVRSYPMPGRSFRFGIKLIY